MTLSLHLDDVVVRVAGVAAAATFLARVQMPTQQQQQRNSSSSIFYATFKCTPV